MCLNLWGSACVKGLEEAAEGKLWLLAVLSCTLEPFGVKVIHSRTFSRTGLTKEAGPFGPKDFSGRYLLYVENESCRCLEYYGLGTKTSACVFTCLSGVTFLLCKCLYQSSLLWAVPNEHREMNASERTMASCAM